MTNQREPEAAAQPDPRGEGARPEEVSRTHALLPTAGTDLDYVIDVVHSDDPRSYPALFEAQLEEALAEGSVCAGELYAFERSVRDADYQFVALYTGRANGSLERAQAEGKLPALGPGHRVKRTRCAMQLRIGLDIPPDADRVFLINPFEITAAQIPEVLEVWGKAKDHMVSRPGFVDARLFRSAQPDGAYGLVNLAGWETEEAFFDAFRHQAYNPHRERSETYSMHPSLCRLVTRRVRDQVNRTAERATA